MNNDSTEDREVLNTMDMLTDGFFSNYGKKLKTVPKREAREIPQEEALEDKAPKVNSEKVLMDLFDIRDELIDMFDELKTRPVAKQVIDMINRVGNSITYMGGKVESFDPYISISGLQTINPIKTAEKVISNTKEAYVGNIGECQVDKGNQTITIIFNGTQDTIEYKAIGTIIPKKKWSGNEAIDYIYTYGEGRMSVKAPNEDGEWVDKSSNYEISWELYENDIKEKDKENNNTTKQENTQDINNNIEEEIGDFEIQEKPS